VEWSAVQTVFETSNCDALLLLDCCSGASAAPQIGRPNNITETIAACGFETWAPRPGPRSFTTTLIEVLRDWAGEPPFSAAMLHSEILMRLKHEQPPRGRGGDRVETRRTPTYIVSTTDPNAASITLAKLAAANGDTSSRSVPGEYPTTVFALGEDGDADSRRDRLQTLLSIDENGQRKAPHVLLSVALEEDQVLDVASCSRWLKSFPLLAKHVSIEGVYRSYSTLVILSVPVVLWNLLPDHLATNFIGFVRSANLAPAAADCGRDTSNPIPIAGRSSFRPRTKATFEQDLPRQSVSGMSSLDSGYCSASIPLSGVLSPTGSNILVRTGDPLSRLRGTLPYHMLLNKRKSKSFVTDLLGDSRSPSPVLENGTAGRQQADKNLKKLVVCVERADLYDKLGLTCVLWYGHEVQRSEPLRRASQTPEW
jgi:hypothetical protein